MPAARRDTVGGGLEDLEQPGPAPLRVSFHHLDGDELAGQCKGDEDHSAVCVAAEGIASVGHAFQPEVLSFQGGRARGGVGHRSWGAGRARVPGAGRAILSAPKTASWPQIALV